jgi:hypothetical protein
MNKDDKIQIAVFGLLASACLLVGIYELLANSNSEYRNIPGFDMPSPFASIGPIGVLLICGAGLLMGYAIWTSTSRGKAWRHRNAETNEKAIAEGKEVIVNSCLGCALFGPILVPLVVIAFALFIWAIIFITGAFSH